MAEPPPEQDLAWHQPSAWKNHYELRLAEEVLATLTWSKGFGTLAEGTAAEGRWTFKREGFLSPRVTVREAGREENAAVFVPKWTGNGVLDFTDGTRYLWVNANVWRFQWGFADAEGNPLVAFVPQGGILKRSIRVEVLPPARELAELSLLVLLGRYLMALTEMDAAMAAV